MEDNASRAIMIGAGLFVVILVLTGIILYVNAARNMATVVDKGLNSWDDVTVTNIVDYDEDISIQCTGIDFINFLRTNFMREDIYITISNEADMQNKPISWWKSEIKLVKINVNATITMKKETRLDNNGVEEYLITITGNLFSPRDAYVTDSVWEMKKDTDGRYAYVTDGETLLQIGDTVNYANASWKVLGAENRKILLLGSEYKEIKLSKGIALEEFNNSFISLNDKKYVVSGSARCLSIRDIERLVDTDIMMGEEMTNLTDMAKGMLSEVSPVFLMSVSNEGSSYTAKVLRKENKKIVIKVESALNTMTYYVRPVIALEQYASLAGSQGSWSVSD